MTRIRRRGTAAGFAGAVLVLTGGCGGQPSVVPAGSAGLEVPPDSPRSGADSPDLTQAASAAPTAVSRTTKPKTGAVAAPAATPSEAAGSAPAKKAGSGPKATNGSGGAVGAPGGSGKKATTTGGTSTEKRTAALPPTGTYTYGLTGTSSLGPPPSTSTITVSDAGSGAQLWTLDSRRQDGAGLIEELTLSRKDPGAYLSAYRLDASTGIAGVILEFAPTTPVLLTPVAGKVGTTWPFDLGTSKDGCATAKGTGELLDTGGASTARVFRLTTTVHTVGPASCVAIEGERTQEIHHPASSLLPTQIDSDLRGKVAGVAFKAVTTASRPQGSSGATGGTAGGTAQAPRKAVATGRGRS